MLHFSKAWYSIVSTKFYVYLKIRYNDMKKHFALLLPLLIQYTFLIAQIPGKTWWKFTGPVHDGPDTAKLNLRYLNEKFAGENGFIQLSNDGNSFIQNGKPIRFWACNGGNLANEMNDAQLDSLAGFLSKMGVNIVRFHGAINPHGKGTNLMEADTTEVKNIWRCVAAMKKYGIYSVISPFWPHNGHMGGWVPEEWGIEGYKEKDDLWAVLYFNKKMQEAYKSWVKYLYNTVNPYTGAALKDEPAVAIIQVENEDGVFFWTMEFIKPALAKLISKQFAQWLTKKYGSTEAAVRHWGISLEDDDLQNGVVALYKTYETTIDQKGSKAKRLNDQVEFLARTQRAFYDEMVSYYKNELGCKQLTNGNNWRTASQSRLLDLERWTNSGADVIAVNKYFDPQHKGPNDGWRIDPGDFYGAPSALKNPAELPTNIKQVKGHPMMVTESAWNLPNKYQTEGSLLVAAYGSLTGLDAFFWFMPSAAGFDTTLHMNFFDVKGQHPMKRWSVSTPGEIGMFPANALIQRLGYVKEKTTIEEQRTLKSMFERTVPAIFEEQSFDPNRDFVTGNKKSEGTAQLSPLSFLTGAVVSAYETKKDSTQVLYQNKLIDKKQHRVLSATNEHSLNYQQGIFTLNTPKAKAVSGFLNKQKNFQLDDVIIYSDNEYATIELVSMDDKPLTSSKKILLQVGTLFRPTNWNEEPALYEHNDQQVTGFKILNTGKMPWLGMPAKGSITIKNKFIKKATQLDAAGFAVNQLTLKQHAGSTKLVLPANAYYILLEE